MVVGCLKNFFALLRRSVFSREVRDLGYSLREILLPCMVERFGFTPKRGRGRHSVLLFRYIYHQKTPLSGRLKEKHNNGHQALSPDSFSIDRDGMGRGTGRITTLTERAR